MRKFYCLSFEIESLYDKDEISIAYSVPYTYSTLLRFLSDKTSLPHLKISKLGQSLSGLDVPLLTITGSLFHIYSKISLHNNPRKLS
jgi:hypothetical protein